MKYEISKDRKTLTIIAADDDRQWLRKMDDAKIQADTTMLEYFEWMVCNSELEWISPDETGDLTSAPMLGIRNKRNAIVDRWGYMEYALRSPLCDLRDDGRAVFVNGA